MHSRFTFSDDEIKEALADWLLKNRNITIKPTDGKWFYAKCPEEGKPGPHRYELSVEERPEKK